MTPIFVSEVDNFVFRDNYVTLTEMRGTLEYVDNGNITGNFFIDNKDSVFYTEFSSLNFPFSVWNNYFINNGWVSGTEHFLTDDFIELTVDGVGNYWSDLADGATTYNIQGQTDTAPIRPSADPVETIMEYGPSITIEVTHSFPIPFQSWNFYQNGTELLNGTWNGNQAQIDINPVNLGIYTFLIGVRDTNGVKGTNTTLKVTVTDTTAPIIVAVDDLTYNETEPRDAIVWTVQDPFPDTYEIFRNGTIIESGTWSSLDNLTVDLNSLSVGTYNFTLQVYDTSGNTALDEVIVRIEEVNSPTAPSNPTNSTSSNQGPTNTSGSSDLEPTTNEGNSNEGSGFNPSLFLLFLLILIANVIPLYYAAKSYFESRI